MMVYDKLFLLMSREIPQIIHRQDVKEVDGLKKTVCIVSDIDGTINREEEPEANRINTIGHATEAFAQWENTGYHVSLMSARTLGEINKYRSRLGISGYCIGENGAVIQLPETITEQQLQELQAHGLTIADFNEHKAVVMAATTTDIIAQLLDEVQIETQTGIISSVTSTPEELQQAAGHETVEMAALSMQRLASAYAVNLTDEQIILAEQKAAERGISVLRGTHDNVCQFFGLTADGKPADKGHALQALDKITAVLDGTTGMLPIVIGNASNDISLCQKAIEMGGQGILIPDDNGNSCIADESLIPPQVLRATVREGGINQQLNGPIKQWLQNL